MNDFAKFSDLVDDAKSDGDMYWQEKAKLDFASGIANLMETHDISRADLARALKTSAAHITQSLRGDKNFQIETMVSMARAVGGELHLKVHDRRAKVKFFALFDGQEKPGFRANAKPMKKIAPEINDEKCRAVA